jgi:hypothetical protein
MIRTIATTKLRPVAGSPRPLLAAILLRSDPPARYALRWPDGRRFWALRAQI